MQSPFKSIADELFKNQIKHNKGRYDLKIPLGGSARLNWIGSKHWALLQNTMVKKFGNEYYVQDYYASKIWGHIFASNVSSIVKTKRIMAEMLSLISEHLGFGKIETLKLGYGQDWATLRFYDSPIARESAKLYGSFDGSIDYSICGLVAGSAENVLKRKFMNIETKCIASGDPFCEFQTVSLEKAKKIIDKIENKKQKEICEKILELDKKTDFAKLSKDLVAKQNKKELLKEANYFQND